MGDTGRKMKKRRSRERRIVYSTAGGRICSDCGRPVDECTCRKEGTTGPGDGVVRVRRETKGRRGKTVTTVSGVPLHAAGLRDLAAELKRRCGTGGTVKEGVIVIQGDHRDVVVPLLEEHGYRVKRAGG